MISTCLSSMNGAIRLEIAAGFISPISLFRTLYNLISFSFFGMLGVGWVASFYCMYFIDAQLHCCKVNLKNNFLHRWPMRLSGSWWNKTASTTWRNQASSPTLWTFSSWQPWFIPVEAATTSRRGWRGSSPSLTAPCPPTPPSTRYLVRPKQHQQQSACVQ